MMIETVLTMIIATVVMINALLVAVWAWVKKERMGGE